VGQDFKPLDINDRDRISEYLSLDPPMASELTFTNLFIWRHKYRPIWCDKEGTVIILCRPEGQTPFGLQPFGPGDKKRALRFLFDELSKWTSDVMVCRVDEAFLKGCVDPVEFRTEFDMDNSDYVYLAKDLINLSGRKYHRKKNHLNRFMKQVDFEFRTLDMELVECFMDMEESWCRIRECEDNPDLMSEDYAVREALTYFEQLGYSGGAIQIGGKLEAISLGERLNRETAVIHIEKANPEIPGLYAAINKLFTESAFSDMMYINREQDLGDPGLRKAKESYHPHHMVKKYKLFPK
jgi:hypothetical protein